MGSILNIVLVYRTGAKFGMRDVRLLANQLQKHRGSFHLNIFVLTDVVLEKTHIKNVILLPMKYHWKGWWSKMNLFSPDLEYLRPFLYLDLDTAVINPLSAFLLNDLPSNGVIMLRDFYKPLEPASGVMWLPARNEKICRVWDCWMAGPESHIKKYKGDQRFINSVIKPDYFFQDITKGIANFKFGRGKYKKRLNKNDVVICFHGEPKIRNAANMVNWVNEYINEKM